MTIPVVDLSPCFSSRIKSDDLDALAEQWDRAMSRFGFAIVVGHPVPHQQVSTLHAAIRKFFESTPSELKQSFEHGPYGSPDGGYKGLGYESVGTTWKLGTVGADNDNKKRVAAADIVENYVFRGLPASWKEREPAKAHPVELERLAGPYVARVLEISNVIHRLSARALGVED
ncbi:MAG: 2-oxoglutarate and iron-dependent oxygenase domain-containing protein, partial [Pseudomonadales bacterium]|nr:2-oxoglutarate and iron-dependent oxygenase domain-containing protein [Pseudomonadales bacterium]